MMYKTAMVTGASTGIGKATARAFAEKGLALVLLARREDKLKDIQQELSELTNVHIMSCDVNDHAALDACLDDLPEAFREIDILVNNAGLALGLTPAPESEWVDWQRMINTNCMALTYLTHKLIGGMTVRNLGHIVNVGSIAGTYPYRGGNVYGATKAFVEQFSLNLRADLLGTRIRVTNVEPGMVGGSEFSLVRVKGDAAKAAAIYDGIDALTPEDIAESISWVISQPARVNVNRVEIMPVAQAPSGPAYYRES